MLEYSCRIACSGSGSVPFDISEPVRAAGRICCSIPLSHCIAISALFHYYDVAYLGAEYVTPSISTD